MNVAQYVLMLSAAGAVPEWAERERERLLISENYENQNFIDETI